MKYFITFFNKSKRLLFQYTKKKKICDANYHLIMHLLFIKYIMQDKKLNTDFAN